MTGHPLIRAVSLPISHPPRKALRVRERTAERASQAPHESLSTLRRAAGASPVGSRSHVRTSGAVALDGLVTRCLPGHGASSVVRPPVSLSGHEAVEAAPCWWVRPLWKGRAVDQIVGRATTIGGEVLVALAPPLPASVWPTSRGADSGILMDRTFTSRRQKLLAEQVASYGIEQRRLKAAAADRRAAAERRAAGAKTDLGVPARPAHRR